MDSEVQNSAPLMKKKFFTLPIITFTEENQDPGTENWRSTCKAVREAMEEFGCFIAVYDSELSRVSELATSTFSSLKELFDLPEERKALYTSELPGFGYDSKTTKHLVETFGIEDSTSLESLQNFTNLMWPSGNNDFCETIHRYVTLVSKLGEIVNRMIFESYGVEKYCDSHVESSSFLLRAHSYLVPPENEGEGVHAHTDPTFLSILQQNEVQGLQCSKDETWIPIDFPLSSFVIMAGDALYAWSNGKIPQCFHKVIMGDKERISVGLFGYHNGIIHVPEELADEGSLRFRSFDHFGMLKFRAESRTLSDEERINAYCGVQKKV